MKKAISDTGTIHLFADGVVAVATSREGHDGAPSVCGNYVHEGPFTDLRDDPTAFENLCGNCERSAVVEET